MRQPAPAPAAHADDFGLGHVIAEFLSSSAPVAAADDLPFWVGLYDNFYDSLHTSLETFISTNAGLLNTINTSFVELFGRDLIGNGLTIGDTIPGTDTVWDGTTEVGKEFLAALINRASTHRLFAPRCLSA